MQKSNMTKLFFFLILTFQSAIFADAPESTKSSAVMPASKVPEEAAKPVDTKPKVIATPKAAVAPTKKVDTKATPPTPAKTPEATKPVDTQKAPDEKITVTKEKGALAQQSSAALDTLADAIQKQYNLTRSATFRFEQVYAHPFLSGPENSTTSKGNVAYNKSSGSMMWNYQEPKNRQKKFFINGNKFTFYSISDKIAYTHDCYDKDTLSASVAFLLGTGNLKNAFTITAFDGEPTNKSLSWLSLIPKEANSPVKKISLGATKDGRVLESVVEDPSGGRNHFKFIDFKTNPKIAASVFVFSAPSGVSVQPMPNIQCAVKEVKTEKPAATVPPKPAPVKKKSS